MNSEPHVNRELDRKSQSSSPHIQPVKSLPIQTKTNSIGQSGDGSSNMLVPVSCDEPSNQNSGVQGTGKENDSLIKQIPSQDKGDIFKKRKPIFIRDEEVIETLKKLTPLYRRRIFLQQLRSNWYWIASVIVVIVAITVTTSLYILPASREYVTPPTPPIHASWGIVSINGRMSYDILTAMEMKHNKTLSSVTEAIKAIYRHAGIPIENVELLDSYSLFAQNGSAKPTNKDTVLLNHVAYPSLNIGYGVTESEMNKIVQLLRKALIDIGTIVFDPNFLSITRGSITVRAHSIASFLDNEFPPLDLMQISRRSSTTPIFSSCIALPKLTRGNIIPDDCHDQRKIHSGLSCVTECVYGAVLSGSRMRTCLSSGVWSGWPSLCEYPCSGLQPLSNGEILPSTCTKDDGSEEGIRSGQVCYLHCNPGYKLFGSLRIVCQTDGKWSAAAPICKKMCSGLSPPVNGHMVPKYCYDPWVLEESFCTFYCDDGYLIQGEVTISCLGSGEWTNSVPFCSRTCAKLSEVRHAQVYPSLCWKQSVQTGTSCILECNPSYQLIGSYERTCNAEGEWTGTLQVCTRKCPKIGHQENLITGPECIMYDSVPGTKCLFSCEAGYTVEGAADIICLRDGSWDNAIPSCVPNCIPIPDPDVGELICSGTSLGFDCTLYCPTMSKLIGSRSVTCNQMGLWTGEIGYCVNTCKRYPVPKYGSVHPPECEQTSQIGKICQLECKNGYNLIGESETKCNGDGKWSSNNTVCVRQDQYLIEIHTSSNKLCLKMDPSSSTVFKQEWSKCFTSVKYAKWTFSSNVIRNTDGKSCLAAQSSHTMALLEVKQCNLLDPLQLWEWHSTVGNDHMIKLKDHRLYVWEGYLSYSRILLIDDETSVEASWKLYDVTQQELFSFYGVAHSGQCQPLISGANGRWTPSSCSSPGISSKAYCSYICEDGYSLLATEPEIQCMNGIWSNAVDLECVPDCVGLSPSTAPPVTISPGDCTRQYVREETVCSMECPANTVQVGEKYAICLRGGVWSTPVSTCDTVCPTLVIENGEVISSENCTDSDGVHHTSSWCEVICNEGFYPSSATYNCINGKWDKDMVCSKPCPAPWSSLMHGSSACDGKANYSVGESCSVTCDLGYELVGNNSITCLEQGSWTSRSPRCDKRCFNCELKDDSSIRFLIWNDIRGSKFCMSVMYYKVSHAHEVVIKPWSHCAVSNNSDLWTKDIRGLIQHVGSSMCLSFERKNASHSFVHLVFCDDPDVAKWSCVIKSGYYFIESGGYYLKHNNLLHTVESSIQQHFIRDIYYKSQYEWKAASVNGSEGSVCGIANNVCPQLLLSQDTSFASTNATNCVGTVNINHSCHVQCNFGTRQGTNDPGVTHTCMAYGLWNPSTIKNCSYTSCNPPNLRPNSNVRPSYCNSVVSVSTVCDIDCDAGYVRVSKGNISDPAVCLPNGKWSEGMPQCLLPCVSITIPVNGNVSANCRNGAVLLDGDICSFTCDYDYELVGNETVLCESGSWSSLTPTCSYITRNISESCATLSIPGNGLIDPIGATINASLPYGLVASLICSGGYIPQRDTRTSIKCQGNGEWDGDLGSCIRKCPKFQFQNSTLNSRLGIDMTTLPNRCNFNNSNYDGDMCQPTCLNPTHVMKGTIEQTTMPLLAICGSNGKWSNLESEEMYSCIPRYQRKIKSSNGKCLSLKAGNVLLFDDCSNNGDDMMWFDSLDTFISRINMSLCLTFTSEEIFSEATMDLCNSSDPRQRWTCTNNELVNHEFNKKLTHYQSSNRLFVTYYRSDDYFSSFDSFFRVVEGYDHALSENVTEDEILCRRRSPGYFCEHRQWDYLDDVNTICSDNVDEHNITWNCDFNCHPGMENVGIEAMSCSNVQSYHSAMITEYPIWDPEGKPSCLWVCPNLTLPLFSASGTLNCTAETVTYGTTCRFDGFSCDGGYSEIGNAERMCMIGGHWSGTDLTCYRKCQPLSNIPQATVEPTNCVSNTSLPGVSCNIACDSGYSISGNSTLICQTDGQWSSEPPHCKMTCPSLRTLKYGKISPVDCESSQKVAGDSCVYQCDTGYVLNAPSTRKCQENGTWDGPPIRSCVRYCPRLSPPVNGRLIKESGYNNAVGTVMRTTCDGNFTADKDSIRICLTDGRWSGQAVNCIMGKQFMLVQEFSPSTPICLLSDDQDMIRVKPFTECETTPRFMWTWESTKLRNIAANKCLKAATNNSFSFLILSSCDDDDQNWKCSTFRMRNLLTLATHDLIPAFSASLSSMKVHLYRSNVVNFLISKSIASFRYLQWYSLTVNQSKTVACPNRRVTHCRNITTDNIVMVSPEACQWDNVPVNTACEFSCPDGYSIKGDEAPAKCDEFGYWSKEAPQCLPHCTALFIEDLVTTTPQYCKTLSLFWDGDICRFQCPSGFSLIGESLSVCLKNGKWSSESPTCQRTCVPLQIPMYGEIHPIECTGTKSPIAEGTTCMFSCLDADYIIIGSENRSCTPEGSWSGNESSCIKTCYPFSLPINAVVYPETCSTQRSPPGSICEMSCMAGFFPSEAHYKTCHENGSWVGNYPSCQKYCPTVQNFSVNDVIFPLACIRAPVAPGSSCGLKCKDGYNVLGERSVHCTITGSWGGLLGSCKKKCPSLQKPHYGVLNPRSCFGQDNFAGTICTLSCQNNFVSSGPVVTVCNEDGEWTELKLKCHPGCPPINNIKYGTIHPDTCRYSVQSLKGFCEIHCDEGTVSPFWTNITPFTCMSNGFWNQPIPNRCLKMCRIPIVENAQVLCHGHIRNDEALELANCVIRCHPYYVHTSYPLSTCIDGEWLPPISTCTYNPYPLLIVHRMNLLARCVGLHNGNIVMKGWNDCRIENGGTRWAWRSETMIVNSQLGLCVTAFNAEVDSPLIVAPCDDLDPLQKWDCDEKEPFHLYLKGTDLGPSLLYGNSNFLTLQDSIDADSYFYTFNPKSEDELGTLCSMRPQGGCHGLTLASQVQVTPSDCLLPTVLPGTECRLSCLIDMQFVIGPDVVKCHHSGLWRPGIESFCAFRCPPLVLPAEMVSYERQNCLEDHAELNDRCNYACQDGYVLVSDYKGRTCLKNGVWSAVGNVACKKACPKLENPMNGKVLPGPCISGICTVHCDINFRVEGPQVRVCQDTGLWTEHDFMCVPDIQFPISSRINPMKMRMCLTVIDSTRVVKAHCQSGSKSQMWRWKSHFAMENVASETCLAMKLSSEWLYNDSVAERSLQVNYTPIRLEESKMESDVYVKTCNVTDSSQRWDCETKDSSQPFRFLLKELNVYLDSGPQFTERILLFKTPSYGSQWAVADHEGITSICSRRNSGVCSPFKPFHGATIQPLACYSNFITAGMTCYFQCKGRFTIEGSSSAVCKKDGFWTNSHPSCLGISKCPAVQAKSPLIAHPSICNGRKVREGRTCLFKCPDTHRLVGDDRMICNSNVTWSGKVPSCEFYCPSLSPPSDGSLYPESCQNTENAIGKLCHFSCSDGYDLVGSASLVCRDHGWSQAKPICRKLCPTLDMPGNSSVLPNSCVTQKSADGALCTMLCNPGFRTIGNISTSCSDGDWSNDLGVCGGGLCHIIYADQNGTKSVSYTDLSNGAIVPESVLLFECEWGYSEIAGDRRICGSDGSWIGGEQLCKPVSCKPLPWIYKGHFLPETCQTGENLIPGFTCTFSCDDVKVFGGSLLVECMENGQWSTNVTDLPVCYNTSISPSERHILIFATKSNELYPTIGRNLGLITQDNQRCLVVPSNNMQSVMLQDCFPVSPSKLWRWYGSLRIQNVGTQHCWELNENAALVLRNCDMESENQEVQCGNTASVASHFQVSIRSGLLSHNLNVAANTSMEDTLWAAVQAEDLSFDEASSQRLQDLRSSLCSFMCGGTFTSLHGDFATPNFPKSYPSNVVCRWTLNLQGKALAVHISPVNLSAQYIDKSQFAADNLVISIANVGDEVGGDTVDILYSTQDFIRYESYRGILHFEFHSDHTHADNQQGFAARWITTDLPATLQFCGVSNTKSDNSSATGYPWQAAVVTWKILCDGVLIGRRFVMTLTHCVEHVEIGNVADEISVAYRITSRSQFVNKLKRSLWDKADRIWIPEHYSSDTSRNNIAVLRLFHGIHELDDYSQPICLPDVKIGRIDRAGDHCIVASFHKDLVNDVSQSNKFNVIFNAVILTQKHCRFLLHDERGLPYDEDSYLCAEISQDIDISNHAMNVTVYSIDNNGGAVLQCAWNQNWYAVGAFNYALSDIKDGSFYVFTQILGNYNWIHETLEYGFYLPSKIPTQR